MRDPSLTARSIIKEMDDKRWSNGIFFYDHPKFRTMLQDIIDSSHDPVFVAIILYELILGEPYIEKQKVRTGTRWVPDTYARGGEREEPIFDFMPTSPVNTAGVVRKFKDKVNHVQAELNNSPHGNISYASQKLVEECYFFLVVILNILNVHEFYIHDNRFKKNKTTLSDLYNFTEIILNFLTVLTERMIRLSNPTLINYLNLSVHSLDAIFAKFKEIGSFGVVNWFHSRLEPTLKLKNKLKILMPPTLNLPPEIPDL